MGTSDQVIISEKCKIKLIYVMDMRLPNEYAHSIQVMRMCTAFSQIGVDVKLVLPRRWNYGELRSKNVWRYYGVKDNQFKIIYLPCLDLFSFCRSTNIWFLRVRSLLQKSSYYCALFVYLILNPVTILFTREYEPMLLRRLLGPVKRLHLVLEVHNLPRARYDRHLLSLGAKGADLMVYLNTFLQRKFARKHWMGRETMILPSAVSAQFINNSLAKNEAREILGFSGKETIIVYTGQCFPWKGVDTLVKSKQFLPKRWKFVLVGGLKHDVQRLQSLVERLGVANVTFVERISPSAVRIFQKAADVLVLPNSGRFILSREETSAMKVFEYMSAKRPIVASNLPSTREILRHRKNALLCPPDSTKELARVIKEAVEHPTQSRRLAKNAWRDVHQYTWKKRAAKIVSWYNSQV